MKLLPPLEASFHNTPNIWFQGQILYMLTFIFETAIRIVSVSSHTSTEVLTHNAPLTLSRKLAVNYRDTRQHVLEVQNARASSASQEDASHARSLIPSQDWVQNARASSASQADVSHARSLIPSQD